MAEPTGYGPATMHEIADRYSRRAARFNSELPTRGSGHPNIVLVLSESFADPTKLSGLTFDEDPIPHTRKVMQSQWGGSTLASFYGTGTSTMEFQALTGQADALFEPQLTTPYQQLLPGMSDYPSAVSWLDGLGYRTVAIHAYGTEMYHRDEVYSIFGFDKFVHDTTMGDQATVEQSPFISDEASYNEVVHQIRDSESPVFAHLVTMQNHVPTADWYSDPVGVTGVTGSDARSIGGYARGLSYTDSYLPGFLEELRATEEPTVVVFFGDHFPGIFGYELRSANDDLTWRTTPLFVWSTDQDQPRSLPVTNPIDFMPLVMQRIGASLPPYFELLREISSEIGALDRRVR